jgi:arylsulfatase A-like enzyme
MNVIVICSDTFRYDHLGFLKQHPVQTPHLDRLAAESAAFGDFWLCSFPTLVNRIEVFSGRYTFPLLDWGPLPYEFPVLSEVFQRHGFTTALIADNLHLFEDQFGFARGFYFVNHVPGQTHEHFQPPSAPMVDLPCSETKLEPPPRRLERYRRNAYWYQQQGTNTTATVFRSAIEWFDKPPEKFFVWIDAFDPHEPWDAPAPFLKPYPWNASGEAVIWPKSGYANAYSDADLQNMRSLYKAEATQIDYWVGSLLARLRDKGLLADTAVVFCSDHGYYFGEHGLLGKPMRIDKPTPIYEELGHIPLLIRHPNGLGAGKTISGLCQPPDLYATALDLAGISPVTWTQGNSLVPRLKGATASQPRSERGQPFAVAGCHPHGGRVSSLTVLTDEWCLVYSPKKRLDGSELYHVPSDPKQTRNVIADNRAVAAKLFAMLSDWLDTLAVPAARKQQLLYDAPFTRWNNFRHRLAIRAKRRAYLRQYKNYSRGG